MLPEFWYSLSAGVQDGLTLALLLLPLLLTGVAVSRGFELGPLLRALLFRHRGVNALYVALIAVSVGLGVGLIAQERALRTGSARAAEKFDLIVTAPGSELTNMLAAVFLQPTDLPLLSGQNYAEIAGHDLVDFAAPIAFGDSVRGLAVVGSTQTLIRHLADGTLQGRPFERRFEAIAGAQVPMAVGEAFTPVHGMAEAGHEDGHDDHDEDEEGHPVHDGAEFKIVGRLPPLGNAWDHALIVPVEAVWGVHGMADGHRPGSNRLGVPFDPDYFPGTPAVVVKARALYANYQLKADFTRDDMMAFFPGTVLSRLHGLMGDVRQMMSVMAVASEILVSAAVFAGLVILLRLLSRRLALLQALGAPKRFVGAVIWGYATSLILAGALMGIAVGFGATAVLSAILTERTGLLVEAALGWEEIHLVAGFVSLAGVLALIPALRAISRPVVAGLRG